MTAARHRRRTGATAVEAALVLPVLFLVVWGLIAGGIGVFRHQQVACMAREGARWASARGADYATEANRTPATAHEIVTTAVLPVAAGIDPDAVTVTVEWVDRGGNVTKAWDGSGRYVRSVTPGGEYVTNLVRVTVTHTWNPGLVFGPITLRGVSEAPMTY